MVNSLASMSGASPNERSVFEVTGPIEANAIPCSCRPASLAPPRISTRLLTVEELVNVIASGRRAAKAVHARDLVTIILDGARLGGGSPALTGEAVEDACRMYFLAEELEAH